MPDAVADPRWPTVDPRVLALVVPGDRDPVCPSCGARVCWGRSQDERGAGRGYCILSGWSGLGYATCRWRGPVRITDREDGTAHVEVPRG